MDNKLKNDLQDVLQDPELGQEIGADELAVHAAGLTHPNDVELENILAEDWDSVPDHEEPVRTPEDALNEFLYEESVPEADVLEEDNNPVFDAPTQVIPMVYEEENQEEVSDNALMETQEASEDVYYEEDEEEPEVSLRKGRPKAKKGYGLLGIPHMISTVIWLAITVMIGVSLGRVLWVCCADVMAFGKPPVTAYITVTEEDDIKSVSQMLADANLIRYPGLFQKFAEITKKADRINAGTHELGSHLDYNAMINHMVYVNKPKEEIQITFPEGYNTAQTFRLLEEEGVCSVADLEEYAANGDFSKYWFLEGLERTGDYWLEGYLAPDTYRFYTNDDPQNVIEKFLNAFDARFTDIMREDLATMQERYAAMLAEGGYSSEYIAEHPLTLHQVLTIASITERERATEEECYDIAAVLYNRVTNPDILTMGSDATVYYALGDYFREHGELTAEDLENDSPYNTRKAIGIPPGPICNPGAYALYAALDPNDNNFHFFIYDKENNEHLFSETYEEHLRKAEELGQ